MPALLPSAPVELAPARRLSLRTICSRLRAYTRLAPPPGTPLEQGLYGFAQPAVGVRVLASDLGLLYEALIPALLLGAVCAVRASVSAKPGFWHWAHDFYETFAVLAPLPSVIFANHYARLAALVRWRLGFGACGPREMPLGMLIGRLLRQALIVAIGVIPFKFAVQWIPGIGRPLADVVLGLWALHWVVADAFDDAQVLEPGESLKDSIAHDRSAQPPWFVRCLEAVAGRLPGPLARPLRAFARVCDKLALDSRDEIEKMERHRAISVGFAISTAALMATPVLNLFFRPVILVAATHLLGHLEQQHDE